MKTTFLALILTCNSLLAEKPIDEKIIGIWKVISIIEDGKTRPYPNIGTINYEYKNDGSLIILSKSIGELKTSWKASTDNTKDPMELDHISQDGSITTKGVYRFAGDNILEVLFDRDGPDSPRPSNFGAVPVEGLMILKRVDAKTK